MAARDGSPAAAQTAPSWASGTTAGRLSCGRGGVRAVQGAVRGAGGRGGGQTGRGRRVGYEHTAVTRLCHLGELGGEAFVGRCGELELELVAVGVAGLEPLAGADAAQPAADLREPED